MIWGTCIIRFTSWFKCEILFEDFKFRLSKRAYGFFLLLSPFKLKNSVFSAFMTFKEGKMADFSFAEEIEFLLAYDVEGISKSSVASCLTSLCWEYGFWASKSFFFYSTVLTFLTSSWESSNIFRSIFCLLACPLIHFYFSY